MNVTSIRMLRALLNEPKHVSMLARMLGRSERQLANVVRKMEEAGYVVRDDSTIRLDGGYKATLLRDVSKIADPEILLRHSNDTVLSATADGATLEGIIRETGLSRATVFRSILDLQSIGAVTKRNGILEIDGSKEPLILFAKMLKAERERRYGDPSAEIIYDDGARVLRRTPAGGSAEGATTAFSLFPEYGIEYRTVYDYFCEQERDMDMYDILVHSIYAAAYSKDRGGLLISVVFYAMHKDRMDILRIRERAAEFGISGVWLDVESYLRRRNLKNAGLFLPWSEFTAKADMYDVPPDRYELPEPADSLFERLGASLSRPITVFLFGGENMRIKGLKAATKDCDIAVETAPDFEEISNTLQSKMGYRSTGSEYSDEDARICPDGIFTLPGGGRIDLFTHTVLRGLSLSPSMQEGAYFEQYGNLRVGLLRNEHVFLLKAVAGREGDIRDMESLVQGSAGLPPPEIRHGILPGPDLEELQGPRRGSFDWNLVWDEILRQERLNPVENFTATILGQLSYLAELTGVKAPFQDRMRRHVIDKLVETMLRGGETPARTLVEYLEGGDITGAMVRNRLASLKRSGTILKRRSSRAAYVRLAKAARFPRPGWGITSGHIEQYLNWRFHLRQAPSRKRAEGFAGELQAAGFQTIGAVDGAIEGSIEPLKRREADLSPRRSLDGVEAARICIGL